MKLVCILYLLNGVDQNKKDVGKERGCLWFCFGCRHYPAAFLSAFISSFFIPAWFFYFGFFLLLFHFLCLSVSFCFTHGAVITQGWQARLTRLNLLPLVSRSPLLCLWLFTLSDSLPHLLHVFLFICNSFFLSLLYPFASNLFISSVCLYHISFP